MRMFKEKSKVWFFDGNDYREETVVDYDNTIDMYELTDGNFYQEFELFKSKKLCQQEH